MDLPITEHLARYLDDLPYSMEALAQRAGGGLYTWYRIKRQRKGTLQAKSVAMLAKGLGVTEDELARIAVPPRPEGNAVAVKLPLRQVPIYGFANGACGIDLTGDVIPDSEEYLEKATTTDPNVIASFRVVGQSMEPDGIFDGSLVLCERVDDPKCLPAGTIVVCKVGDTLYCKHWRRVGNTILLTSSGPAGKDLELVNEAPTWVLRAVEASKRL